MLALAFVSLLKRSYALHWLTTLNLAALSSVRLTLKLTRVLVALSGSGDTRGWMWSMSKVAGVMLALELLVWVCAMTMRRGPPLR